MWGSGRTSRESKSQLAIFFCLNSGIATLQMGHNYDLYSSLGLVVPVMFLIITILTIPFGFIAMLLAKFHMLESDGCLAHCFRFINNKFPFKALILSAMKILYGHDVVEEKRHGGPSKITIYGRIAGSTALYSQFLLIVVVFVCSALAFWSEFLLDENDRCDSQMDCFALYAGNKSIVRQNPLENCTDFENNNYTIECFKFVFDYADGLGNSGGVLILAKVVASLHITLWVGLASLFPSKFTVKALIHLVIYLSIVVIVLIIIAAVPLFKGLLFIGLSKSLKLFSYVIVFSHVFIFSGPFFIVQTEPDLAQDDNERTGLVNNPRYGSTEQD